MSQLQYYFDKIAGEFNGYYTGRRPSVIQEIGYNIFRGPGLKRRFEDTVNIIGECNGQDILDVGCGPGVYVQYFAKKKANVVGIDISSKMIECARENLLKSRIKDFNLIVGDFMKYDFKENFDYSIAIGLFDYLDKTQRYKYLGKLKDITKKKILATFPKKFTPQAPIRKALFVIKGQPVYFYTKKRVFDMASFWNLKVVFHDSGPIWTAEFIKR